MTMLFECSYPSRVSYLVFLLLTILILVLLLMRLIRKKRRFKQAVAGAMALLFCFALYVVLQNDHIMQLNTVSREEHRITLPIIPLLIITAIIFVGSAYALLQDCMLERKTITENSIKEALDEMPMGLVCFRHNGQSMLCNRLMFEISILMFGKVFLTYDDFQRMLTQRSDLKERDDVYRLSNASAWRFSEEELVTADGEHFTAIYFSEVTELIDREKKLEVQNKELRKLSVEIRKLRENVYQLAKEEEMLAIKTKWHDVMGEGLTAIRRTLLSPYPQQDINIILKRWIKTVAAIRRDNEDPDQGRDATGDLFRDASALNIELILSGEMPETMETKQVFFLAIRNCLLNAAQHAKATKLYADTKKPKHNEILYIHNNGIAPKSEIVPRGGLINVINYAERIGGKVEIRSLPRFELIITMPGKEDDIK